MSSSINACSVCLAPGDSINHLDHLVPLAHTLGLPVVVDEELLVSTIEKYYPQVKPIYIDHHARILEYFAQSYDFLFVSSANYRADLSPLLEVVFRKKMQFWYCPHGNSDKPIDCFKKQNFTFIYGKQQEDRIREAGFFEQLEGCVRTGNYRFPFYRKQQEFYDSLVDQEIFSLFANKQPTILYAPTWHDLEKSSSLFNAGFTIIDQLPSSYNLIVKLHPWLSHHQPGHVYAIKERYQDKPNIVVLDNYSLVLPILERVDIYLGDFSSIGYDFLYYNRPMFFFDSTTRDQSRPDATCLHQCGTLIPQSAYNSIYSFIEKDLKEQEALRENRAKLYDYAFGDERSDEEIRRDVNEVISSLV